MNGLALCAGYGGLELGIERIFPEYRTVCFVERECYVASQLIQKMENGTIHEAPVWSNVVTFEGQPWRGKVDIISGGFPCQPYSSAGKQMGKEDERDLWLDFVRIISEVRPGFLFFENVSAIVKQRLSEICLDLTKLGYHASWCVVAASDVGAPHRRKRWFLFAVLREPNVDEFSRFDTNTNKSRKFDTNANDPRKCPNQGTILKEGRDDIGRICSNVSDTCDLGRGEGKSHLWGGQFNFEGSRDANVPHTNGKQGQIQNAREFPGVKLPCSFSEKGSIDKWGGRFESWWKIEPSMGRLVDGAPNWVDKLRMLGNGVVPQQAAYALQILGERLAWGMVENRTPKL